MGEVIIKINKDGSKVEVDAEGFHGGGCLILMEDALNALGGDMEKEMKPEYHEHIGQSQNVGN